MAKSKGRIVNPSTGAAVDKDGERLIVLDAGHFVHPGDLDLSPRERAQKAVERGDVPELQDTGE